MKTKKSSLAKKHKAKLKDRRPAHKRLLLHPAAIFFLLCVGVLLIGWTWRAGAVSYSITARLPAPPLTEAATISSPSDGAHLSSKPIDVSGTCPDDSYVKIIRNGELAGVAFCDNATNTYGLQVDLVPGPNQLESHDFNITDDEGPAPIPITVYYNPPPLPATSEQSSSPTSAPAKTPPFTLTSDYQLKGYSVGVETSWQIRASGGSPPYAIHVKWGDAKEDTYSSSTGEIIISHIYKAAGDYRIKISGADSDGNKAFLQLAALVKNQQGTLQITGSSGGGIAKLAASAQSWLWLAWPAYLTLVLMVSSYFLGEQTELAKFRRQSHSLRRRHRA